MAPDLHLLLSKYFKLIGSPPLGDACPILDSFAPGIPERLKKSDPDFHDFMNRSFPEEAAGGAIRLHGFKNLAEEHLNLHPSRELIQQGFLSIAKDPDGSQYCYHLDEGAIYHLDDCGPTANETSEQALAYWASFKDFLEWLMNDP